MLSSAASETLPISQMAFLEWAYRIGVHAMHTAYTGHKKFDSHISCIESARGHQYLTFLTAQCLWSSYRYFRKINCSLIIITLRKLYLVKYLKHDHQCIWLKWYTKQNMYVRDLINGINDTTLGEIAGYLCTRLVWIRGAYTYYTRRSIVTADPVSISTVAVTNAFLSKFL